MSFSVGIVGLPNVGKSTLFSALTKNKVDIADYPFTTIDPNMGVVAVPDKRLEKISEIVKPEKTTPTIIKFVDIAGLVKGAHKGEGLGNQFLSHIRECDAILEVIRGFSISQEKTPPQEDKEPQYQLWEKPEPKKNIEVLETEMIMKDLGTIEKVLTRLKKESVSQDKKTTKKIDLFEKIKNQLSQGKKITGLELNKEEIDLIKDFQFLTSKPHVFVLNVSQKTEKELEDKIKETISEDSFLKLNLELEREISNLKKEEEKELGLTSELDSLITACYNTLDLITFYTITGGKETRAWTLKKGGKCPTAGGVVHSDFEDNFIKAEVISSDKLIQAGSWKKAKKKGQVKTVGKDYIVQDGDIIEFKIY